MVTLNILDYGAVSSDQLQTEKIQKAIDDCYLQGGGRVVIPAGWFLTGGLRLRSHVELYLESGAILRGSQDPEDYFGWQNDLLEPVAQEPVGNEYTKCPSTAATTRWCNALIRVIDAEDVAVTGEKGSYFDGANVYDPQGEGGYRGPHGISIWRTKNIRLTGYTFLNSANWAHAIFKSSDITIRGVSVFAGNDGIDIRTCDNVLIEDCVINSGDDPIAGFDNNDVIIRNCELNTACICFRFGGNNILIENCVSDQRNFIHRRYLTPEQKASSALGTGNSEHHESACLFSYYCDHRAKLRRPAGNIVIRNVRSVQNYELLRLEFDGYHRWCCNRSLRDITFENVTVENIVRSGELWGDPNEKVTCVFRNCHISAKEGEGKEPLFIAANFDKIVFEDCVIEGFEDPCIYAATEGRFEVIRSTPIRLVLKSEEECIAHHSFGIAPIDNGTGRTFKLDGGKR